MARAAHTQPSYVIPPICATHAVSPSKQGQVPASAMRGESAAVAVIPLVCGSAGHSPHLSQLFRGDASALGSPLGISCVRRSNSLSSSQTLVNLVALACRLLFATV